MTLICLFLYGQVIIEDPGWIQIYKHQVIHNDVDWAVAGVPLTVLRDIWNTA